MSYEYGLVFGEIASAQFVIDGTIQQNESMSSSDYRATVGSTREKWVKR
ncbi:hypothetical protein LL998_22330 [Burkholderia ambifaria]|nr:hypothetical protein [Burkholderia ambifaria]UEP36410.1 hypothetical protein LL998_22330 [Burkholderia ambifaria]